MRIRRARRVVDAELSRAYESDRSQFSITYMTLKSTAKPTDNKTNTDERDNSEKW